MGGWWVPTDGKGFGRFFRGGGAPRVRDVCAPYGAPRRLGERKKPARGREDSGFNSRPDRTPFAKGGEWLRREGAWGLPGGGPPAEPGSPPGPGGAMARPLGTESYSRGASGPRSHRVIKRGGGAGSDGGSQSWHLLTSVRSAAGFRGGTPRVQGGKSTYKTKGVQGESEDGGEIPYPLYRLKSSSPGYPGPFCSGGTTGSAGRTFRVGGSAFKPPGECCFPPGS